MEHKGQEEGERGFRKRVKSYASRRFLGGAVGLGSGFIRDSAKELRIRPDFSVIRKYWTGPATPEEGTEMFDRFMRPNFPDDQKRKETAQGMTMVGVLILTVSVILGLSALFVDDTLFKISALFGFFVLAVQSTVQLHRADQLRQGRFYGLREMF